MKSLLLSLLLILLSACGTDEVADPHAGHTESEMASMPAMDHSEHDDQVPEMDHSGHEGQMAQSQPAFATDDGLTLGGRLYTCGMHPHVITDEPGNCPICGMTLVPLNPLSGGGDVVEIDSGTIQTIGVRTATVEVAPIAKTVRTTGRFEMDEQGAYTVALKVRGWVERLHVDFEGALVRRGQPLLDLYSPALVNTQEELLLALKNLNRLPATAEAQATEDANRLVVAARQRLEYYDVSPDQIAAIEAAGVPSRTIRYPVPASGEVMEKMVVAGQQIQEGQPLLKIYDTRQIWVLADVFEQDLPWVSEGTRAQISVPYVPGEVYSGRVDHLYYMMNQASRTAQARIILPRTDARLRPGMYAVVELQGLPSQPFPVVPEESVVFTGSQSLVILDIGAGRFRPVPVEVGLQAGGRVQITSGLSGGERVVTSAQFLIDSEARLKSAVSAMIGSHQHGS